jgi:sugar O-acyltransferase (sialic acid O-acetyltransferase NeuD family)
MKITLIGTGGHAASVCETIREGDAYTVEGLLSETMRYGEMSCGLKIIGHPDDKRWLNIPSFIAVGDNWIRERFSKLGYHFVNVRHPSAQIGNHKCTGTYYGASSFVGANAVVGNFCIINTGAILEHDSSVGDFSHLATGVVTGGRVTIGHHTTIGLGAMIRDGITIGDNCVIGMGSVVVHDVPDGQIWLGNPARFFGNFIAP